MSKCEYCNCRIPENERTCPRCGAWNNAEPETNAAAPQAAPPPVQAAPPPPPPYNPQQPVHGGRPPYETKPAADGYKPTYSGVGNSAPPPPPFSPPPPVYAPPYAPTPPVYQAPPSSGGPRSKIYGLAIAGMVLTFISFGFLAIIGILFSFISLIKGIVHKKRKIRGALASIIIGAIGLGTSLFMSLVGIMYFAILLGL